MPLARNTGTGLRLAPHEMAANSSTISASVLRACFILSVPAAWVPDPASSVVDSRLRMHGLDALRVINASIFPSLTSGNTNAPTIMVGEKGADLLLEDAV